MTEHVFPTSLTEFVLEMYMCSTRKVGVCMKQRKEATISHLTDFSLQMYTCAAVLQMLAFR